ncbi:MAG TPA: hypothetical protein VL053_10250 [Arachidicoccus sp.]|nr:hypothetical protein [Arachidicoccus sp.]
MKIIFKNKKLEILTNNDKKLIKEFGTLRATKIKMRLSQLSFAQTLEGVKSLPGNYHELTKNRKGQWACDLDQPYRLVFTPQENPIPVNQSGQYIWAEIEGIEIIEIVNYHKEK